MATKRKAPKKSVKSKEPKELKPPLSGLRPKDVVIVESPGKIKTISKILGSKFKVMASFGHVRDLPTSRKAVDLDTFEPTYVVDEKKKKVVAEILDAVSRGGDVYLCSDPDREGEAISHHLAVLITEAFAIPDEKIHRVTFNEITEKAILAAFAAPRKIDMNLVNSQQARRVVDRIVGYDLTNLIYNKVLVGLTGGRVQSVAVRLVAEREREIMAFKPEEYWTIAGQFGHAHANFDAYLKTVDGKRLVSSASELEKAHAGEDFVHLKDEASAESFLARLNGPAKVLECSVKDVKESPYAPFTTSSLQQAAANVLGFDTKRTMGIAQRLYEGVVIGGEQMALITYMRTDSVNVSKDAQKAAQEYLIPLLGKEYCPDEPPIYKSKKSAQEAHECVRPTHPEMSPDSVATYLEADMAKLYELVWNRFMASQMSPAVFESATADVEVSGVGKGVFRATGRRVKFDGWRRLAGIDPETVRPLPTLAVGDPIEVKSLDSAGHFTEPPPRFNEASLVRTMESEGIGRPSTYASIISLIQLRGYVKKVGFGGKAPLRATEVGMVVTESLVGHMASVMDLGFTRDLEEKLDLIADGDETYGKTLKNFYKGFAKEIAEAKANMPSIKEGEKSDEKCPKCSGPMTKRLSKGGPFLKCDDPACGTTLNINDDGKIEPKPPDVPTGLKCDACGSDVVLAKGRFGEYLCCVNYKEKKCDYTMKLSKYRVPARKFKAVPTDVTCEECEDRGRGKTKMVVRIASRSKKKPPTPFLSCPAYPKCRHAENLPEDLKSEGEQAMLLFERNRAKDAADAETFKKFIEEHEHGD